MDNLTKVLLVLAVVYTVLLVGKIIKERGDSYRLKRNLFGLFVEIMLIFSWLVSNMFLDIIVIALITCELFLSFKEQKIKN